MNKEKPFSSYRWKCPPIVGKVEDGEPQSKEERIKNKKTLLKILVKNKTLTQEEANQRLEKFLKNIK